MKEIQKKLLLLAILPLVYCCGELDTEKGKEFYKQEVYIVSSESTNPEDREIYGVTLHTFVDTTRIMDLEYNSELFLDNNSVESTVIFKIGIGGSLQAHEDIEVIVAFDTAAILSYNVLKNINLRLPDMSEYTTNIAYDNAKGGFPVIIKKGTSSLALRFNVMIERAKYDGGEGKGEFYHDFAFALKIIDANLKVSPIFHSFMIARLDILSQKILDWSEYPIPLIPIGRYHSRQCQSGTENAGTAAGDTHKRVYKFITPLEDPDTPEDERNPELANQFIIWGHGNWAMETQFNHGDLWMYGLIFLNENGAYTYRPLLQDDVPNFPKKTFDYLGAPDITENNKYDPRSQSLTIEYGNIMGESYIDVLTFVDDNYTLDPLEPGGYLPGRRINSWQQLYQLGYNKYWLPLHAD